MVSLSAPLVNEVHPDCRILKSFPLSCVLWELVARAHEQLIDTQVVSPSPERLAAISMELGSLDDRHDDVLRGLYYGLEAQEYLAKDPAIKAEARRLREKMFPNQLLATRKSYRGQAGQAVVLKNRLSAEDIAHLGRLSTLQGGTFADAVEEWLALAETMGTLENERSEHEDHGPSAADVVGARNNWICAIQAFVTPLRLRDDVPAPIIAILDRIEGVIEAIARRRQAEDPDEKELGSGHEPGPVTAGVAAPVRSVQEEFDGAIPHELLDLIDVHGPAVILNSALAKEQVAG